MSHGHSLKYSSWEMLPCMVINNFKGAGAWFIFGQKHSSRLQSLRPI